MATPVPVVLTATMVSEATAGRIVAGDPARVFNGVSTDTRSIVPGSLFVALHGDRFDGHAFVAQAISLGAAGVLVDSVDAVAGDTTVIVVADTLVALQSLAKAVRQASHTTVIAITGSAGKTTTKEVTAELLSLRYRVLRNKGNLNNHIGLPLSLIELRSGPELAVVELGMNHFGEIRALVGISVPDVRVWTNVGDAHIGYFGTREAVARAKAEILEQAGPATLVVANADDALVMAHVATFRGRRLTFGEGPSADVRATSIADRGFDGTSADVLTPAGVVSVHVPLPGRAHLSNVLAAVAVAVAFDVPLDALAARIATLQPSARRGSSAVGHRHLRVVDDSYNASPAAVHATLSALAATATTGRRVVVLGEMLELGIASAALHEECGRAVATSGIDVLVAIGGAVVDHLVAGALAGGMVAGNVHRFSTSAAASEAVLQLVQPNDLVLIKGSRGTRTDLVADRLLEVA